MKHIFSVLFFLSVIIPLSAQQYVLQWADTLDNGSTDFAYGVAIDANSNVYITGRSDIGADYDYFTIKYDSLGNIV